MRWSNSGAIWLLMKKQRFSCVELHFYQHNLYRAYTILMKHKAWKIWWFIKHLFISLQTDLLRCLTRALAASKRTILPIEVTLASERFLQDTQRKPIQGLETKDVIDNYPSVFMSCYYYLLWVCKRNEPLRQRKKVRSPSQLQTNRAFVIRRNVQLFIHSGYWGVLKWGTYKNPNYSKHHTTLPLTQKIRESHTEEDDKMKPTNLMQQLSQ